MSGSAPHVLGHKIKMVRDKVNLSTHQSSFSCSGRIIYADVLELKNIKDYLTPRCAMLREFS